MVCVSKFISSYYASIFTRAANLPSLQDHNLLQIGSFKRCHMFLHFRKIRIYPRGNGDGKGNSVSAFLSLDESTLPPDTKVFVKFILRVIAQNQTKDSRVERESKIASLLSSSLW